MNRGGTFVVVEDLFLDHHPHEYKKMWIIKSPQFSPNTTGAAERQKITNCIKMAPDSILSLREVLGGGIWPRLR